MTALKAPRGLYTMSQVSLVPVLAWVAALACWGITLSRAKPPLLWDFAVDRALRFVFLFPLGLVALWAFAGHVFFPDRAAAAIGWQPSPFQYEVGVANLGIGLASLYAAFAAFPARVAVAIAASCLLMGAGIGHVHLILSDGNLAPGNAGPILFSDFLAPLAAVVLLVLSVWQPQPKSPDSLALKAEFQEAKRAMKSYRAALNEFGKK